MIIHPNKRDGGIMKCFLKNDEIIIGNIKILKNCLHTLGDISQLKKINL